MFSFLARRLLYGVLMILAISFLAFTLLYLSGGDIARTLLGDFASEAAVRQRAYELGLDRPILVQYWDWLTSAFRGDFGDSWFRAASVSDLLTSRLAVTLSLVLVSITLTAIIAMVAGVWAALHHGGLTDRLIQTLSLAGAAIPNFLIALALVTIFAIQLRWLPPTGFTAPATSVSGWLRSITLPVIALVIAGVASSAQQFRSAMIDVLQQDYIRTLRSRGLPIRSIIFRHALRNAAGPGMSVLALQFVGLLAGTVVIENLFAIPGMGSLTVQSTLAGDIPVIMGLIVLVAIVVVAVNLLIDVMQGWLNPKVRIS